ncbi:MAG: hypothetical protein WC141_02970 [Arcobacteraceae bacterium]
MDLIQKLNAQVEKANKQYEQLKFENNSLKLKLEEFQTKNDKLLRNAQDMLLKIDSALVLKVKVEIEKENDFLY